MIQQRQFKVAIYDTDASGLIFFGAPARWIADAEVEFLGTLQVPFPMMDPTNESPTTGLSCPSRGFQVSIDAPLRYFEVVTHRTWVSSVGRTSFVFSHEFEGMRGVAVRATCTRVFVDVATDGAMTPVPVPSMVRDACAAAARGPSIG